MRRPPSRTFLTALFIFVLVAISPVAASASVKSMKVSRVKGGTVVFNVKSLKSSRISRVSLRLGSKKRRISPTKVRRAARRKGVLRIRLSGRWRRALASGRRASSARRRRLRLVVVMPAPAGPAAAPPIRITGRAFYVSPRGSDSNPGTSPSTPWRTVTRANRADLGVGDGVLFEGGATYSDDALMPPRSGAPGRPMVYGAYGSGKATFTQGAWFRDTNWVAFTDLAFTASRQGVSASENGTGSGNVVVQNSSFRGLGIAINAANHSDRNWTLRNNSIDGTRDSGFILNGDGHVAQDNSIVHTGTDHSIPYGKHGIYLKSSNSRATGNDIRDFESEGISTRYRNAVIENNTISEGQVGIGWYQNDSQAGTSYWRNNTISRTTAACLYVSPSDSAGQTRESFVISNNRLSKSSGNYTDLQPTSGTYSVD